MPSLPLVRQGRQGADLVRATAGVDQELDGDTGLAVGAVGFDGREAAAQLPQYLLGEIAFLVLAVGLGRHVLPAEREVLGQPGGGLTGAGQSERPHSGQDESCSTAGSVAHVGREVPAIVEEHEPGQEVLDVPPAERCRLLSPVVTLGAKAVGQQDHAVELHPYP